MIVAVFFEVIIVGICIVFIIHLILVIMWWVWIFYILSDEKSDIYQSSFMYLISLYFSSGNLHTVLKFLFF